MRKIFILAMAMAASFAANASYLYWQVSTDDYTAKEWSTAKIMLAEGTVNNYSGGTSQSVVGYLNAEGGYTEYAYGSSGVGPMDGMAYVANFSSATSGAWSYWVELYNGAQCVGVSQIGYISDASSPTAPLYSSAASLTASLTSVPTAAIWHGGTYSVPEPTSAMLMLFGAAFLGLKRKNRRIA